MGIDRQGFSLFINEARFTTQFKVGDIVTFVTDEDEKRWMVYGYLLISNSIIKISITRNGMTDNVYEYELKIILE